MMLADYVPTNVNNNKSMAAEFLDVRKSFDETWH
jgi:hypothetical protein